MNENTRKGTMRNAYRIIKLDKDNWDDISDFTERYDYLNIIISTQNATENYDTMKTAYDAICEHTDDIHIIKINASKADEQIELTYTNEDINDTNLQKFSYTCTNDRERKVRDFYYKLREESKVFKKESYIIYRLLQSLCFLALYSVRLWNYFTIITAVAFIIAVILALSLVLNDRIMNPFIGKKQIQFWISKDKIDEYENRNIKARKIAKAFNIASIFIFAAALIIGLIAIILTW